MDVGDSSEARQQLDSVLSSLYDFGDEFVNNEDDISEPGETNGLTDENVAEKVNSGVEDQQSVVCSKRGKKNVSMFFDSIKDELCSQSKIPPVCSQAKIPPVPEPSSVEVVTFVSHKNKKQSKDKNIKDLNSEKNIETEEDHFLEFNLEKARLEVHKFGIKGYQKDIRRKFEQERAIMLGAKPPKKEHVDFKLYQKRIKEKDQEQKNAMENGLEPVRKKQKQGKSEWRSRKSKGTVPSGQVGRFRDGALILSRKDIDKIKKSKVIK